MSTCIAIQLKKLSMQGGHYEIDVVMFISCSICLLYALNLILLLVAKC